MRVFIYNDRSRRTKITLANFLARKVIWFKRKREAQAVKNATKGVLVKKARKRAIKKWGVFIGSELSNFWSG